MKPRLLHLFQDETGNYAGISMPESATIMGHPDPCVLNLPFAATAPELFNNLVDLARTCGTQWMTLCKKTATGVYRHLTAQPCMSLLYESPALAFFTEAEILIMLDLCKGETIMDLNEVNVLWSNACHSVGLLSRPPGCVSIEIRVFLVGT